MQHRMKTHQLNRRQIDSLLDRAEVASLATVNADGTPYVTPVHFLYQEGAVYVHGLFGWAENRQHQGKPRRMSDGLRDEESAARSGGKTCDTNTGYQSVILQGTASLLADVGAKKTVLEGIVRKYTPALSDRVLPENMIKGTAVLKIRADAATGKYYGEC